MIVFQVLWNFDPANEILKIRCQFYISMKKVIIPWKIQAIMKNFVQHSSTISVWAWTKKRVFFFIRVFFTDTHDSRDSRGREGNIFYSTLPHPPAHEHYDIYLQLSIWDDYHVFLIATLVFARLLLDEIYHLIELPFEWLIDDAMFVCLLDELILGFCYSDLTLETGGFELASTITLVLQANRGDKVLWFCGNESHEKETTEAVIRRYHILQNRCS